MWKWAIWQRSERKQWLKWPSGKKSDKEFDCYCSLMKPNIPTRTLGILLPERFLNKQLAVELQPPN